MKNLLIILALLSLSSSIYSAQWFVIVAGSNGYDNYRHQADTCHAYQIAKSHGVPETNIIHFAFDDIAHNFHNPFPGKIFNKPDGKDVYKGCKIDYRKHDVTPSNYLKVLKGEKTSSTPKVLESTANDTVFLNFADHGAPGLIAFPSTYLYATDLLSAFQTMASKKMFGKLIYYLESCESGSMFANLPTDLNIYAVSAANATESSWGTYCHPDDKVQGKHIKSCLGDLFSVVWMEDVDSKVAGETLSDQYVTIVKNVNKSNPLQFGTKTWLSDTVASWTGPVAGEEQKFCNISNPHHARVIDSRDNRLHYLINMHAHEMSNESMNELNEEIISRKRFDDIFTIVKNSTPELSIASNTDFDCYKSMIDHFENKCGKFSDYGMKYMRVLYDICYHASSNTQYVSMVENTKELIESSCL